jgi:hypothetical protein
MAAKRPDEPNVTILTVDEGLARISKPGQTPSHFQNLQENNASVGSQSRF